MNRRYIFKLSAFIICMVLKLSVSAFAQWQVNHLVTGRQGMEDGLALDKQGNIYVSQYDASVVRKVTPTGEVSVYANGLSNPNGLTFDANGNLYITNAGGGRITKVLPNGTAIHNFVTGLSNPTGVAVNAANDTLFIAHYQISRISKVALNDSNSVEVVTSGAPLNGPVGLAWDDDGILYAGNFNNGGIIKIAADGSKAQIAQIPPSMGFLTFANGGFYATSFSTHRIYRVSEDGTQVSIFAGTGQSGQENGNVATASFNGPNGIVATPSGDTLYVSEYNTETLRMLININPTNVLTPKNEIPTGFILQQNYPNPFNPNTQINFSLPEKSFVNLEVFNVTGRKVATLLNCELSPAEYSIKFDAAGLAAGLYLYRLSTPQHVEINKMLLVK